MSSSKNIRYLVSTETTLQHRQIHQGDTRRLKATSTNSSDVAKEPTQVKIKITLPDATTVTYAKTASGAELDLTQESTGIYYVDYTFSQSGVYKVAAAGSGNMAEVDPVFIEVIAVNFAP